MPRPQRPTTTLVVESTEQLTPGMVRVRFTSPDLSAFAESTDTDRYVKLVFDRADGQVVRTYTALEPDVAAGTVIIDFVVHGTEGVAGPWAAQAKPGDTLSARGPGGGYAPDPTADWHLLAGDQAGLPAIRAALAALPAEAVGYAVIDVPSAEFHQDLVKPDGIELSWLDGADLVETVRALPWREGRVHAFVHGEAESVMHGIRPYLLKERELPRADVSISGYWRVGRTEETFREWKRELAESEGAGRR
ncbi:MAG: siderophore-interacting protein [Nocardioides sp.]|uniref:siderophore-interacting protein n=1 Tax=Nocardioides sp. TaxID=35761 RepID=UPI0039E496B0